MAMYCPPKGTGNILCVVCGATDHLGHKLIKANAIPPWVWLLLPVAPIPALLFAARVEIRHEISMLVCDRCRRRQNVASAMSMLVLILCVTTVIVAIALGLSNGSWLQFLALGAVAWAMALGAGAFKRHAFPRYSVLTQQRVEVEVPGKGRVVVLPT